MRELSKILYVRGFMRCLEGEMAKVNVRYINKWLCVSLFFLLLTTLYTDIHRIITYTDSLFCHFFRSSFPPFRLYAVREMLILEWRQRIYEKLNRTIKNCTKLFFFSYNFLHRLLYETNFLKNVFIRKFPKVFVRRFWIFFRGTYIRL